MNKLQVISQIILDGELMIFMTMTLGLRIGYLLLTVKVPKMTKINFLLTISIHHQQISYEN